jgi:hypothetical protein
MSWWEIMKEATRRLKKLVKQRKTKIVVTEQGSIKQYSKPKTTSTTDYYSRSFQN